MIGPQRAPVRPRVISPSSGESVLLEDEILSLVERRVRGLVWLVGGHDSSKTTALAHLAAVLPASADVILRDNDQWQPAVPDRLMVRCGITGTAPENALRVYQLAPWTIDEIIEYLLAVHRDRCESVMRRCRLANDMEILKGNPDLWRQVLDVLAADEGIQTIKEALCRVIDMRLPAGRTRELVSKWCLAIKQATAQSTGKSGLLGPVRGYHFEAAWNSAAWLDLLWHERVELLLATEQFASQLRSPEHDEDLRFCFPQELIQEAARLISDDEAVLIRLKSIIDNKWRELEPTAASLLHAANVGWRPEPLVKSGWRKLLPRQSGCGPRLYGAYLRNAAWPGVILTGAELRHVDLSGADLTGANLDDAVGAFANLCGANLTGASLERVNAADACLAGAELSCVRASKGQFQDVDGEGARFEGAMLKNASFRGAKLTGARFARANLTGADLFSADIEGADFSQVEFQGARLDGLVLRLAEFRNCSFRRAYLRHCDLEGMVLPGVDFQRAILIGALFTGSVMPRANFRYAKLVNAGLAEIEWEHADLRSADLRGASFHMGSSRSGLVESPIASLGTRTGFYTDDFNEQDFKTPEEIRKANLRGADLRGAKISGVDFYLVDLRDALYDASQEQQLRSSGAILESRVP